MGKGRTNLDCSICGFGRKTKMYNSHSTPPIKEGFKFDCDCSCHGGEKKYRFYPNCIHCTPSTEKKGVVAQESTLEWDYLERMVGEQSDLHKAFWEGYISSLLKQREQEIRERVLNKLLENGHGGGNWRRLIISELEKDK